MTLSDDVRTVLWQIMCHVQRDVARFSTVYSVIYDTGMGQSIRVTRSGKFMRFMVKDRWMLSLYLESSDEPKFTGCVETFHKDLLIIKMALDTGA